MISTICALGECRSKLEASDNPAPFALLLLAVANGVLLRRGARSTHVDNFRSRAADLFEAHAGLANRLQVAPGSRLG